MEGKSGKFGGERTRQLVLSGAALLFVVIALVRIYSLYLRPQLDRGHVRSIKSSLFASLTRDVPLLGTVHLGEEGKDSVREILLMFDRKGSDTPTDPADPAFPLKKYQFAILFLRPLSPEFDPNSSEHRVTVRGSFPPPEAAGSQRAKMEYRLEGEGFDLVATIKDTKSTSIHLAGKVKDPWHSDKKSVSVSFDTRLTTGDEVAEMQSQRKTLLEATVAERQRRALRKWDAWELSIREQVDLHGSITPSDKSAKLPDGRLTLPVRAKLVSSGLALRLSLSVDKFPRDYLPLVAELYAERQYDEKPPKFSFRPQKTFRPLIPSFIEVAPEVAPATISGRIAVTLEGKVTTKGRFR